MRCPWCGNGEDKVVDSRSAEDGAAIRRRRECLRCGRRFTTYERLEETRLVVIKRDGSREPFDREKIVAGVTRAIKNRPVPAEEVQRLALRVEETLRRRGAVATSQEVGLEVLTLLQKLDEVAYVRFASVYKDFQQVTDFERELGLLLQKREKGGRRPPRAPARPANGR